MLENRRAKGLLSYFLLLVVGGVLVFKPAFSNEKFDEKKVGNWLTLVETPSGSNGGKHCHALVVSPNWALSTSECIPENRQQKIKLRLSGLASQPFKEVDISYIWEPFYPAEFLKSQVYPVLLRLASDFAPPFPDLSYEHTIMSFTHLSLKQTLKLLWRVHYLNRNQTTSELYPEFRLTTLQRRERCFRYPEFGDWSICTGRTDGSGRVLSSDYHSGAVLMDEKGRVVGLGETINKYGMDKNKNYFIPLRLYRDFIQGTLESKVEEIDETVKARTDL
ncbi:hypothetical protein [Endozoicomonas euniceicola]|uniref:Peptidase S1 domain-containing protein n=1 Tax=Endozoicomonas euniceicola TaxID=1234143 RepID=A0ABY6GYZ9_9GAMM|nr:hypothetical protein [Endozoicomonas euniceicola]UYM17276.1 hypothetical protein NX720_04960 [Endozoicomonas euniceicola]